MNGAMQPDNGRVEEARRSASHVAYLAVGSSPVRITSQRSRRKERDGFKTGQNVEVSLPLQHVLLS